MSKPWVAQIAVSETLAKDLIEKQFSQLSVTAINKIGEGWDNTAFVINHTYVFRFPRREIAVGLLQHENQLLPALHKHLNINIPLPEFLGKPSDAFAWPFSGYKMLKGITADKLALQKIDRQKNLKALAAFLKQLHNTDLANSLADFDISDEISRLDILKRTPQTLERFWQLEKEYNLKRPKAIIRYLENIDHLIPSEKTSIVHGDLYAKHLLMDDKKQLCGIIDWGDAHRGDKAVDLAVVQAFLPHNIHEAFLNLYGYVCDKTWSLAFFRAIYSSVTILCYGLDMKDKALAQEALFSLKNLEQNSLLFNS